MPVKKLIPVVAQRIYDQRLDESNLFESRSDLPVFGGRFEGGADNLSESW